MSMKAGLALMGALAFLALMNPMGLSQRIARSHPGFAAYTSFFPTFFNFQHRYTDGRVFHFLIGQPIDFSKMPEGARRRCLIADAGRLMPISEQVVGQGAENTEVVLRCREGGVTFNLIIEKNNSNAISAIRLATGVWE